MVFAHISLREYIKIMTKTLKGITKSGGRKHTLDKFYTNPVIAKLCLERLNLDSYDLIIEPSAGSGSFSSLIPNAEAYDISPEADGIIQKNWFDVNYPRNTNKNVLVVGNPPFGEQNQLAIDFINHAADFANTIAFVLPLSFMKESVQKKLNLNLHLIDWWELPKKSFLLAGEPLNVPCVFQVWDFSEAIRTIPARPETLGFDFVPKTATPDFYLQRIGGRTGSVGTNWEDRNIQSNYFIKVDENFSVDDVLDDFRNLDFPYRNYGVGPRSLSKKEVLLELKAAGSRFVK